MTNKNYEFTQSKHLYHYSLEHTYSYNGETKEFSAYVEPALMKMLIAYIEFYSEEHYDPSWSIGYDSLLQIIDKYYVTIYEADPTVHSYDWYVIDQYINRESHCGTQLYENKNFDRNMKQFIKEVLNKEKLNNQQKEGENAFNQLIE